MTMYYKILQKIPQESMVILKVGYFINLKSNKISESNNIFGKYDGPKNKWRSDL